MLCIIYTSLFIFYTTMNVSLDIIICRNRLIIFLISSATVAANKINKSSSLYVTKQMLHQVETIALLDLREERRQVAADLDAGSQIRIFF